MIAQPSPAELRAINTVFAGLALTTTAFRLLYRWRLRRCWWDDAWAGFSMLAQFVLLIAVWIRTDVPGVGPLNQSQRARMIAYWVVSNTFTTVLWTARMSLLFSAIRIIPRAMTLRRIAYFCAILFGCMWATLVIQKAYICGHDTAWENTQKPQCYLGIPVGILELITDCIADGILVAIPLRLIWDVNLPRDFRHLLFATFSASVLVTVVSIVHAVFLLGPSGYLEGVTANVECAVSLIVSNLAVVVTFAYRLVSNRENIDHTSDDTMALNGLGGHK